MTAEELLLELKDIQMPPAPEWWLIAPAYLAATIVVVSLFVLFGLMVRHKNANRLIQQAQHELELIKINHRDKGGNPALALNLCKWLKQVSMLAFPEQQLASLCGQRWLEFLDQSCEAVSFANGAGRVFAGSVYCREPEFDAAEAILLCEQWLIRIKPRLVSAGRN